MALIARGALWLWRVYWRVWLALFVAGAIMASGAWLWRQFDGEIRLIEYPGLIIALIMLWIRPEYMFLLFYVLANYVLAFLFFDAWQLTAADAPAYAMSAAFRVAIALAIGAMFVALFKRLKARKPEPDEELDRDIERIRAEIAARDGAPPSR